MNSRKQCRPLVNLHVARIWNMDFSHVKIVKVHLSSQYKFVIQIVSKLKIIAIIDISLRY